MTERKDVKSLHNCSRGLFLPQHAGSNANLRGRLRVLVLLFRVFIFERRLDFIDFIEQCALYITQTFKSFNHNQSGLRLRFR
jgi:hypothetical protein